MLWCTVDGGGGYKGVLWCTVDGGGYKGVLWCTVDGGGGIKGCCGGGECGGQWVGGGIKGLRVYKREGGGCSIVQDLLEINYTLFCQNR